MSICPEVEPAFYYPCDNPAGAGHADDHVVHDGDEIFTWWPLSGPGEVPFTGPARLPGQVGAFTTCPDCKSISLAHTQDAGRIVSICTHTGTFCTMHPDYCVDVDEDDLVGDIDDMDLPDDVDDVDDVED